MSEIDPDANLGSVHNDPFARRITWRVFNEHIFPKHSGTATVVSGGIVAGRVSYAVPEHESLSLTATINGRERFQDAAVTRAVLEAVSPSRTYETKSGRYVWRLVLWGAIWVAAFALAWPTVNATAVYAFIVLLGVMWILPLLLAGAVVDFCWWAGRGFANESRIKWTLAIALWLLDVGPLIYLQIRVL